MYNKHRRSYEQEYHQDGSYDRPYHERPKFKDQRYERNSYLRSRPIDNVYRDKRHGFNESNFYDSQNNGKTFRFSSDPNHIFSSMSKPKFDLQNLPPVEKYFYNEHPDVADRSEEEVEKYREELNIRVQGKNVPKPITKFSELCLPDNLMKVVTELGHENPTPIQAQGWPIAFSGRDMVGVSQTGSGKTFV
ncbi:ATP-dependent RNA helicase DBP2-like, partial [Stegodyphus dumicola]|uniref:ATP-dependent RNA helicase DBP2-like n=1 Tax=Stegodyphus dumicola TaxID=202533 RepID=UPI0015AC58DD